MLEKYPDTKQFAIVRHNYAQSLHTRKDGIAEARRLWSLNVDEANYIPSRISIANDLLSQGDRLGAIEQYRAIVLAEPDGVSPRLRLAELLEASGNTDDALAQIREASRQAPESVLILERMGDLQALARDVAQARSAYESATSFSTDLKVRMRLAAKIGRLP